MKLSTSGHEAKNRFLFEKKNGPPNWNRYFRCLQQDDEKSVEQKRTSHLDDTHILSDRQKKKTTSVLLCPAISKRKAVYLDPTVGST